VNEPKLIEFPVVGEPLKLLLTELGHKLSREWPTKYAKVTGARELFVMHTRVAQQTFEATLYACGDVPPDPRRKPEFAVCLPPLNRALLDSLLTLMFIMEDVPSRYKWFREADWKEARLDLDRYKSEYGQDANWQPWLTKLSGLCDLGLQLVQLTPEQVAKPSELRSWLNPGAMCKDGISADQSLPPVRAFMKFLYDFFYIDLSQQAHLGGYGIAKRGAIFIDGVRAFANTEEELKKYRLSQLGLTTVFVLALATEIQNHFKFDLKQSPLYIWTIAKSSLSVAEELYGRRYRDLLGGA
jgi:hypothetical protein